VVSEIAKPVALMCGTAVALVPLEGPPLALELTPGRHQARAAE
jgi:hypothetical protein